MKGVELISFPPHSCQKRIIFFVTVILTGNLKTAEADIEDNYSESVKSITIKSMMSGTKSNIHISTFIMDVDKYGGVIERLADIDEIMYPGLILQSSRGQGNESDVTYLVNCAIPHRTKVTEIHCPLEFDCVRYIRCFHDSSILHPSGAGTGTAQDCKGANSVNVYYMELPNRSETYCSRWYSVFTGSSLYPNDERRT